MTIQYQLCPPAKGNTESMAINRFNDDGSISSIPFNEFNRDYQAYLAWVAEGNTPEPAEVTE